MDFRAHNTDPELQQLLKDWQLEHHYAYFMEQQISMKVLRLMQAKHIDKLFHHLPVGDQAIFEHHLDIWRKTLLLGDIPKPTKLEIKSNEVMQPEVIENTNDSTHMGDLLVPAESNEAIEDELLETMEPNPQTFHISTPQTHKPFGAIGRAYSAPQHSVLRVSHASSIPSTVSAPSPLPTKEVRITLPAQNPTHVRYSLSRILNETSGGQVILNYYDKHKILREEHRTALINVIARYIDANGCTLSLSESNNLENQIVEMFPTEREEFYRTSKRGRLYNKIANMKRIYKKFKRDTVEMTQSGPSSPASSAGLIKEEYVEEFDDFIINDMRNNIQTAEDFLEFWKRSQTVRLKDIDVIDSLQDILEKWPEYKQPNAVDYITMDFMAKFPTATRFSEVFYENVKKLEKLLFAKVSTCSVGYKHLQLYRKCSKESQHLVILWVLHQLFPPNHQTKIDEMGVKRKKRYSIQDSQNSCICIRGTKSAIDNMLRIRTTATPPLILVVGELGAETEELFVYFEGLRYPVNSVVQAAELCCELFFLFNIDFPEESVLYYNFIQTFFLNIPPETKNSKIYTTINEINACEM